VITVIATRVTAITVIVAVLVTAITVIATRLVAMVITVGHVAHRANRLVWNEVRGSRISIIPANCLPLKSLGRLARGVCWCRGSGGSSSHISIIPANCLRLKSLGRLAQGVCWCSSSSSGDGCLSGNGNGNGNDDLTITSMLGSYEVCIADVDSVAIIIEHTELFVSMCARNQLFEGCNLVY